MDVLLDSHAALWWAADPALLSTEASRIIADAANVAWFSSASAWELSIKVRSGRLEVNVASMIRQLADNGVRLLGIGVDDGVVAGSLDWEHRDPFDRMLVAQATNHDLRLVTRDQSIRSFVGSSVIVA